MTQSSAVKTPAVDESELCSRELRKALAGRDSELAELHKTLLHERNHPFALVMNRLRSAALMRLSRLIAPLSAKRARSFSRSAQKRGPDRPISGLTRATALHPERYQRMLAAWAKLPQQAVPAHGPLFSLVLHNPRGADVSGLIASLLAQSYSRWELWLPQPQACAAEPPLPSDSRLRRLPAAGAACPFGAALQLAEGSYCTLIGPEVRLQPHALAAWAEALTDAPETALLYSDEDRLSDSGLRSEPHFKPQWNRLLSYGQDYIGQPALIRSDLARAALTHGPLEPGAEGYDLLLRSLESSDQSAILHLPQVLFSRTAEADRDWSALRTALQAHLQRQYGTEISVHKGIAPGTLRPVWPLSETPLISILIPTRDHLGVLKQAVESVLHKTQYRNFEIIIIDNNSEKPETLAWLDQITRDFDQVRVLRDPRPFNYSQLNNGAAAGARGEFLLLLNNDIEVIAGDWLEEMLRQALRPGTGCVGAKLLYPDGRVQHGGVVIGIGGAAGHSHKFWSRTSPGYFNRLILPQEYQAVTAACLLVRKSVYFEVGGLNETDLTVAFNDVDFCLKVQAAGYSNVWTPAAELYHHESISRGKDTSPERRQRFQREEAYLQTTWGTKTCVDPAYSPHLTLWDEDFTLREL